MKLTTTLASICLLALTSTAASAHNVEKKKEFIAADDSLTTKLCIIAAEGNRVALHKALKAHNVSKRFLRNKVGCNEESLSTFVSKYGNNPDSVLRMLNLDSTSVTIQDLALVAHEREK